MDHAITVLPPQARRQEPNVGIINLPNEILHEICCHLCLHCHHECVVIVDFDLRLDAFEDQKALARLSQCSQRLRKIAQPVLFHWYQSDEEEDEPGGYEELDRFVSFMRPILRHPTLAASTRALALYNPRMFPEESHHVTSSDPEGSFGRAFEAVGGSLLQLWRNNGGEKLYLDQLQMLAMASTPALSQLRVSRESDFFNRARGVWSYLMPNLKCLTFFAGDGSGGLGDDSNDVKFAMSLLRHAPNLESLVALDCWGEWMIHSRVYFVERPWGLLLTNLKRLSLNDVTLNQLVPILDICPLLEDLEYFDDHRLLGLPPMGLTPVIGRLRTTLRRLCYSILPVYAPEACDDPPLEELRDNQNQIFYKYGEPVENVYPDLSGFPVLEVLELEQLVLYGPVFPTLEDPREDRSSQITTPEHILRRLPPSLRQLRIGCVGYWPTVHRDLLALAEEPSRRFPRLQAVTVEVFEAPPEHQHRHLDERLSSVLGVSLVVCYVARSHYNPTGLLSARSGKPTIVPRPILFS